MQPHAFDPYLQPELFRGVLTRRVFAFLIDLVVLSVPVILGYLFIAVFGLITLGLGWALFWLAWPASVVWAIVYYGASLGGPHSATVGMRVMDLELRTWYGAPGYFVLGATPRRAVLGVDLVPVAVGAAGRPVQRPPSAAARRRSRNRGYQQLGPYPGGAAGAKLLRIASSQTRLTVSLAARCWACPALDRIRAGLQATGTNSSPVRAIVRRFGGLTTRVTQHSRDTPQFYLTAPSPCPYLPGRHERKVFTHLVGDKAGDLNDLLTHGGFRRSQSIAYRPACDQCRACVSVRVVANEFRPSRNFRKIMARNADIVGEQRSAVPTSEQYSVFRAYLDQRHRHGGMADMTVLDYAMMVEDSHVETRIIEYRRRDVDTGITGRGEDLIAVALTDVLSDGLSMVYSFFEPSEQGRSLGTFMILDHITRARRLGLPYVYLGYWIEGSKKMDYKGRFLPQQRLAPSGWLRIDASGEVLSEPQD